MVQGEHLKSDYGVITNRKERVYFSDLVARLAAAATEVRCTTGTTPTIVLLDTSQPLAISPGGGEILISRGIVVLTQNEAELAFVLAHELSHYCLGHQLTLAGLSREEGEKLQRQYELAADRLGILIHMRAGYDPRYATSALVHTYGKIIGVKGVPNYPGPDERVLLVQGIIVESGWTPPGTIDRRDFQALRNSLLESPPF